MRLPSDLKGINPLREERKFHSTTGEIFFDKSERLVACLTHEGKQFQLYQTFTKTTIVCKSRLEAIALLEHYI